MSFIIYVYISLSFLFIMYLTLFWLYRRQKTILARIMKIIIGLIMLIAVSFASMIAYFIVTTPMPAVSENEAVNLAIKEMEMQFQTNNVKDKIRKINRPELSLWFDQNRRDLLLYHISFAVGNDLGLAGISVTVNAKTGEVYDIKNKPNLYRAINGHYEYSLFRLKNIALKIRMKINSVT